MRMKVGILTFHRAYNYGAVLQCYALQQFCLAEGAHVCVINYKQNWIDSCFKVFSWQLFSSIVFKPRRVYGYLKTLSYRSHVMPIRKKFFTSFVCNNINVTSVVEKFSDIPQNFDLYIIGSDQLWAKQCLGNRFDSVYLGCFSHSKESKVIGYAISTNLVSIDDLQEKQLLEDSLDNFDAISFREKTIADHIAKISSRKVPMVCVDPTLLLAANDWDNLINQSWESKNYVAVYQVRGNMQQQKFVLDTAYRVSKQIGNDCEIIDLSSMNYSVEDFVSIIKYASFVVTSSFHATVFSIIFKTSFKAVLLDDGLDERYVNLIDSLRLSDVTCHVGEAVSYRYTDYTNVDEYLTKLKQPSANFIKTFL